ncbi:TrmH family RNA methyltransferase [Lentibacillus amyloliquefaciens]|uniref:RNA methyltransferase n=1 Tax=Lentibacillus amyloliquefaciens TaxID=1472767 RepID=A0A0U3WEN1_9BACI|nr:RNA methyltransferase [Lentibacillus amyloliquefaciens]ALX48255.1 RNA methyltransferase [Lentibacillus amyloliquefaciens]
MITSLQNAKVKQWMKLHKRKGRTKYGEFLVEGFHLIEEAYRSGWRITEIILEDGLDTPEWYSQFPLITVNKKVMQQVALTETPQGAAAVVEMNELQENAQEKVLLIDSIQDPGNLGTMIRTADASGFDAVVLGNGTVDMYNDKVIRATQGSLFHIPVLQADLSEKIPELQTDDGFTVLASALEDARLFTEVNVPDKVALIVGNEGLGINEDILRLADKLVKIPIYGQAESLNVSVAAGILMYAFRK